MSLFQIGHYENAKIAREDIYFAWKLNLDILFLSMMIIPLDSFCLQKLFDIPVLSKIERNSWTTWSINFYSSFCECVDDHSKRNFITLLL